MKIIFKILLSGFNSLADGFDNLISCWDRKPKRKIKYKKIVLNEILKRDVNDLNSGWRKDAENLKKDWDKVVKK